MTTEPTKRVNGGIYLITNIVSGKIYVGSAKNFEGRWKDHLSRLRRNKHINVHLQRSFNKNGEDSFIFSKLIELGNYNKQIYFAEENKQMEYLKSQNKQLYNIAKAEGGWTFNDIETKQKIGKKISESLKKAYAKLSVEERKIKHGSHLKGTKLSQAAKDNLSKKLIGRKKSEKTKVNMRIAQNDPILKDSKRELMRQIGITNKGKSPPNKGCKATDETKQKLRLAKLGKKLSEEHKANIKKSLAIHKANKKYLEDMLTLVNNNE